VRNKSEKSEKETLNIREVNKENQEIKDASARKKNIFGKFETPLALSLDNLRDTLISYPILKSIKK